MAKSVAERRFHAGGPPRNPTRRAVAAAIIGVLAVAAAAATLLDLRDALASLDVSGIATDLSLFALGIIAAAVPLVPALLGLARARQSRLRLNEGDVIGARVQAAASRNASSVSLGLAATQILVLLAILFLIANDLAVSRTFFYLPQIRNSLVLILKAFWINIYIFMIAEVLVLIWGLAVAIARLAPGAGGRPIRLIATFYVDLFRGLPAIVNVYLIGFGIPLTGLPILKDLSQEVLRHPGLDADVGRLRRRSLPRGNREHPLEPDRGGTLARPQLYAGAAFRDRPAGRAPDHSAAAQ